MDPAGQAPGQRRTESVTRGGVRVRRTDEPFRADDIDHVCARGDERRGGVLSSGMEYPGRYSRWHLAYVNPCAELVARGRVVTARALNARGEVLLPVLGAALARAGQPTGPGRPGEVSVAIPEPAGLVAEEDRSRRPTVFSAVREVIAAFAGDDPHLGLYGAFGYDLAFQFEPVTPRFDRPATQRDLVLHLPDELYVVDRKRETAMRYAYEFTVAGASTEGRPRDTPAASGTRGDAAVVSHEKRPERPEPGTYARVVDRAKDRFARGDLFEVVPSQAFRAPCSSAAAFYELLRRRNPAPYEFFFNLGEGECLVGASPEMYVRVTGDRVETCPISGTIRRGTDPLEDAENIRSLLNSAKEESELTMCTDVDRNDKSRVCVPGSVTVIGRRQIEMYSRLIHTVDHIEGRLRPGLDALDAFLTHMWAVTVTGAPKIWAMQFIEDHEQAPRRWYGGAVGMIGFDGNMNTGLTLRTAHIENGVATVRAGATLLFDSDPAAEEAETELKARALLETLAEAAAAPSSPEERRRPACPPPRRPAGSPVMTCGCCLSTTRTRSCTRWRPISPSRGPRSPPCVPGSRPPRWTTTGPIWSCCRRAPAGRPTSPARTCSPNSTRAGCPRSACALGFRPWSSTPAGNWRCCLGRRTGSPARCCAPGRTTGCWPGCRPASPRPGTTRCTRFPVR